MFSLPALFKLIKWGSVLAVIMFALVTYRQGQANIRNLRDNLIEANAAKVSLQAKTQELENAKKITEASLEVAQKSSARAMQALAELNKQFSQFRQEALKQQMVFEEHDLQRIANAKPGLIEVRSNQATEDRFNEIENLLNQ